MKIFPGSFLRFVTGLATGLILTNSATAGQRDWYGPTGSKTFGHEVKVLPNGNVVVVDQQFTKPGGAGNEGAVYLFSSSGSLISQLTGSRKDDQIGSGGITVLANGNFVTVSQLWDKGAVKDAGAVTWASAATGITGEVSAANSLVGTRQDDWLGNGGATPLTNGNYVVASSGWDAPSPPGSNTNTINNAGAVTFCNGSTGTSGEISAANSLVGSSNSDSIGSRFNRGGVIALPNGHYVVSSPRWKNGSVSSAGAVTWCSGTTGRSGVISPTNSLTGSTIGDGVGGSPGGPSITILANGDYVVASPWWRNGTRANAGAVTWCSGNEGRTGPVTPENSLIGSRTDDYVGTLSTTWPAIPVSGVIALTNGHYVVQSPFWDKGNVVNTGALTWGDGTKGVTGPVSESNSVTGTVANDQAGRATALSGGKYVAWSPAWDNGPMMDVGAVRLLDGTGPASGEFSELNSLVGTAWGDSIGFDGVTALTNGNFVVASSRWDRGTMENAGAVTWVNATTGLTGPVTEANSLVGAAPYQSVGGMGSNVPLASVVALSNGNYVVASPFWGHGTLGRPGAVTWGDGSTGTSGVVGTGNSITGAQESDMIGVNPIQNEIGVIDAQMRVTALNNGNYVISSPAADQALTDVGSITWANGSGPSSFAIGPENSFFGTEGGQKIGNQAVMALANGNFALPLPLWKNGSVSAAGALRLVKGTEPLISPATTEDTSFRNVVSELTGASFPVPSPDGSRVYVRWPAENRVSILSFDLSHAGVLEVRRPSSALIAPGGTLDFGDATLTFPRILNLEVINAGYEPLILQNPVTDNSQFTLTLPPGTTTLAPKAKILVPVTFTPATAGPHTSLVRFTTNDPAVGLYEITLTGHGLSNGRSSFLDVSGGNTAGKFGTHAVFLPDGNLVVTDPGYDAPGPVVDGGAAYLYSASGNLISTLTGSTAGDQVGLNGIKVLTNGNYLICSSRWQNNGATQCGAVTWASGITGVSGVVSATNSLVGSTQGDDIGGFAATASGLVYPLKGGNYVVGSPRWKNGASSTVAAGAVTWGNGSSGVSGTINAENSLIGEPGAEVGKGGIIILPGDFYVVGSLTLPGGPPGITRVTTLGRKDTGVRGILSVENSLGGFLVSATTPCRMAPSS